MKIYLFSDAIIDNWSEDPQAFIINAEKIERVENSTPPVYYSELLVDNRVVITSATGGTPVTIYSESLEFTVEKINGSVVNEEASSIEYENLMFVKEVDGKAMIYCNDGNIYYATESIQDLIDDIEDYVAPAAGLSESEVQGLIDDATGDLSGSTVVSLIATVSSEVSSTFYATNRLYSEAVQADAGGNIAGFTLQHNFHAFAHPGFIKASLYLASNPVTFNATPVAMNGAAADTVNIDPITGLNPLANYIIVIEKLY